MERIRMGGVGNMSEKRVFEGELLPVRDKYKLAICEPTYGDDIVTIGFASREEAMKWAGKAVRVIIEPLSHTPDICHEEAIALVNSGMNKPMRTRQEVEEYGSTIMVEYGWKSFKAWLFCDPSVPDRPNDSNEGKE